MGLQMEMRLETKLELRLEQRVQLLQLNLCLPEEFLEFINLEDDEDRLLLMESLPFMVLHEVSHPLYDYGKVYIPELKPSKRLTGRITELGYHNAVEIGIDRSAMLIGPLACRYPTEVMVQSHVAIAERIYRDMFKTHKFPVEEGLLARLQAALQANKEDVEGALQARVAKMERSIDSAVKEKQYHRNYGIYKDLVAAYSRVYGDTRMI